MVGCPEKRLVAAGAARLEELAERQAAQVGGHRHSPALAGASAASVAVPEVHPSASRALEYSETRPSQSPFGTQRLDRLQPSPGGIRRGYPGSSSGSLGGVAVVECCRRMSHVRWQRARWRRARWRHAH